MKIEKFKLLLYLKKGSCDKSGKIPIMGRITVNRSMAQFSCKLSCSPNLWNPRESRLNGKSHEAVAINAKLEKLLLTNGYNGHIKAPVKHSFFGGLYCEFGFAVRATASQKGIHQFALSLPRMSALCTGYDTFFRSSSHVFDNIVVTPLYLLFGYFRKRFACYYYLLLEFISWFHRSID